MVYDEPSGNGSLATPNQDMKGPAGPPTQTGTRGTGKYSDRYWTAKEVRRSFTGYIIINVLLGPFIINAIVNGLIAWGTYHKDNHVNDVTMWNWDPSGLGSDIMLTSLIEPLLTWLIAGALQTGDCRRQRWWFDLPLTYTTYPRWLLPLRNILTPVGGGDFKNPDAHPSIGKRIGHGFFHFWLALRGGLVFSIPFIIVWGGIAAGIMTGATHKHHYYFSFRFLVIFKALWGAIFALFITPAVMYLAFAKPDAKRAYVANNNLKGVDPDHDLGPSSYDNRKHDEHIPGGVTAD